MLTNYYTLKQLVSEWNSWIRGSRILELYSQRKGELSLVVEDKSGGAHTVAVSVQAPLRYLMHSDASSKARKNVARLFESVNLSEIEGISIDLNDRLIEIQLVDSRSLRVELFGPSANVYLIDETQRVLDSFRKVGVQAGETVAPALERNQPELVLASTGISAAKRIRSAYPNLGRWYANEAVIRSEVEPDTTEEFSKTELSAIRDSVAEILRQLESPQPTVYWKGPNVFLLSLMPLALDDAYRAEQFPTADEAVRVYVRRRFSQSAYDLIHGPIDKQLRTRLTKAIRSLGRMQGELEKSGKADTFELFGHLLMSSPNSVPSGAEAVTLPDIVSGHGEQTIPLRSELSAVQNAERFYAKARDSRQARIHLESRINSLTTEISVLEKLSDELADCETVADVRTFAKKNAPQLKALAPTTQQEKDRISYRRYELDDGYEVWVGRNAAQNDRLTTQDARKYDLWLHARGVAGSHTVLRIPRRQEKPPARIIEKAASIAAFHSKARSSEFAPVIVAEKRYVRKPRKSPLGSVVVEREEVLIVRPEIPRK